jgi:ABC-type antimicrobial peptide transport system permease subunit
MMPTLLQDLRYAVRWLARNPGFAAVAILTVALGIGTVTTIFSIFDAAVLRPLLSSLLFGIASSDAPTYGALSLALFLVAAAACWLPARRAMRVDPAVTLRTE